MKSPVPGRRKLEDLADNLALFAVEFGIEFDGRFAGRLATIGFANGVVLGLREAGPAGKLEELLCAEAIPPAGESTLNSRIWP